MQVPIITLTTDFGIQDVFVGVMKGVILRICPQARLVDLSHQIAPQDVLEAAWLLQSAVPFFSTGTIHLAVVDPGVGTVRKPIAIKTPRAVFVGPDNGIFYTIWKEARQRWPDQDDLVAVELTEKKFFLDEITNTFHGRDVFAPVAAHLAMGVPVVDLGPPIQDLESLLVPKPVWKGSDRIVGVIVHVDRFGNCITNIRSDQLDLLGDKKCLKVFLQGMEVGPVRSTYADVSLGEILAIIGSDGYLELALRQGNLSRTRSIGRSTQVSVTKRRA